MVAGQSVSRRGYCQFYRVDFTGLIYPGSIYPRRLGMQSREMRLVQVDRLAAPNCGNVAAICFPVGAAAINSDVVQLRGGHRQQACALALNTRFKALLVHPLTQYLHEAASKSDAADGEVVRAIFGVVSHGDTYQFV